MPGRSGCGRDGEKASQGDSEGRTPVRAVRLAAEVQATRVAADFTQAQDARRVARTLAAISKAPPAGKAARSDWLAQQASKTLRSRGPLGKTGARGRLKGHLFEDLDVHTYNRALRNRITGRKMVKRTNARNVAYDASKYKRVWTRRGPKWKFAGAVQHKTGPAGIESAIAKMNRLKPGSASKGTARLPKDKASAAARRAGRRTRVQGSKVTSTELETTLNRGLEGLRTKGVAATSRTRAVAGSSARSGGLAALVGGVLEGPALIRGDTSAREFAENRSMDVAEGGTAAAIGTVGAGAVLGTGTGSAAAATLGGPLAAAATSAASTLAGMGPIGAAASTGLGSVSAATAGPAIVTGAVMLVAGHATWMAFAVARRHLRDRQVERRLDVDPAPSHGTTPPTAESVLAPGTDGRSAPSGQAFVDVP